MPNHPLRKNGFSRPWSTNQLVAACTMFFIVASFYVIFLLVVDSSTSRTISLIGYSICLAPVMILWLAAEIIDPASDGSCTVRAFQNETVLRYDREMGKMIPGLDHHCKWLNTGIGRRNYLIFFSLILLLMILFTYQFVAVIIVMSSWGYVLLSLYECIIFFVLVHVIDLVRLHIFLIHTKQSTYSYLMALTKKQTALRRARREEKKINTNKQQVIPDDDIPTKNTDEMKEVISDDDIPTKEDKDVDSV